jgi:hypothetical protein
MIGIKPKRAGWNLTVRESFICSAGPPALAGLAR